MVHLLRLPVFRLCNLSARVADGTYYLLNDSGKNKQATKGRNDGQHTHTHTKNENQGYLG